MLVIYLNLRESDDTGSYPLRDDLICSMLSIAHFPESQSEFERNCCAFFAAIFQTIRGRLQETGDWNTKLNAWRKTSQLDSREREDFFVRVHSVENIISLRLI